MLSALLPAVFAGSLAGLLIRIKQFIAILGLLCTSALVAQGTQALQLKAGTVDGDLFASLNLAGIPDDVALSLVRELSQVIQLDSSVNSGDRFSVLYERPLLSSTLASSPKKLLAFEYATPSQTYAAYWFEHGGATAVSGYFQANGVSLRPAYLRTPLEIVRVSSNFGSRKHPRHKGWRVHEGTDFAAPIGTRVFAAGDGVVELIGNQNGFGKVIKLKHAHDTQTVYAHLSLFAPGLLKGHSVKQGDVIGFVGKTGWATGPHLHYEYRVNQRPLDPFSEQIPITTRIPPELADVFVTQIDAYQAHFSLLSPRKNAISNTAESAIPQ